MRACARAGIASEMRSTARRPQHQLASTPSAAKDRAMTTPSELSNGSALLLTWLRLRCSGEEIARYQLSFPICCAVDRSPCAFQSMSFCTLKNQRCTWLNFCLWRGTLLPLIGSILSWYLSVYLAHVCLQSICHFVRQPMERRDAMIKRTIVIQWKRSGMEQ